MKQFKKGQWVWWNDPDGKTSGIYQVMNTYEEHNAEVTEEDIAEFDDRMILIGNRAGSEAEVYATELESPKVRVIFRRWTDHETPTVIALFPDVEESSEEYAVLILEPGNKSGAASYQGVIRKSEDATDDEYAPLLAELRSVGFNHVNINTHRNYQHEQIMEFASELAEKKWTDKHNAPASDLYTTDGALKHEHEDEFADYYEASYAQLARLAGYEEEAPLKYICSVCAKGNVRCETISNPNTKAFYDFGHEALYHAYCMECEQEVVLIDEKILHRDIDLFHAAFVAAHGAEPRYVHCRIVRTDFEHDSEDDGTKEVDILLGTLPPSDNRKVFCQCDDIAALKALSDGRDRDFALVDCFSMS